MDMPDEKRENIGKLNRKIVEDHFTREHMHKQYTKIYNELTEMYK